MMAISKEQVFLVSGRSISTGGKVPRGPVVNIVVCSTDDGAVRMLMEMSAPDFSILSITSLVSLEAAVKKVKASLAGIDQEWMVVVDPTLQALAEAC